MKRMLLFLCYFFSSLLYGMFVFYLASKFSFLTDFYIFLHKIFVNEEISKGVLGIVIILIPEGILFWLYENLNNL